MPGLPQVKDAQSAQIAVGCGKCGKQVQVHAPFVKGLPVPAGAVPFPADNMVKCPDCGTELNLAEARRQLEGQTRKAIVTGEGK